MDQQLALREKKLNDHPRSRVPQQLELLRAQLDAEECERRAERRAEKATLNAILKMVPMEHNVDMAEYRVVRGLR